MKTGPTAIFFSLPSTSKLSQFRVDVLDVVVDVVVVDVDVAVDVTVAVVVAVNVEASPFSFSEARDPFVEIV